MSLRRNSANYTAFLLIIFLISSCKNDVNIIDEWKETTVVYGLLNRSDTVHYIKINKAFLGEDNALTMANVMDSSAYGSHLQVSMEKWTSGVLAESYVLVRDSTVAKNQGIFSYPSQILYRLDKILDDNSEYRLNIYNPNTGHKVNAKTNLVKEVIFRKPVATISQIELTNPQFPIEVIWLPAQYGRLYQLAIRFYYDEEDKLSGIKTERYTDWVFGAQKDLDGSKEMKDSFYGEDFYKFLASRIEANNDIIRHAKHLQFSVSVAADAFNTYMEVNEPSLGIVQEKAIYTNIENGIGLFSSRSVKSHTVNGLSANSLKELSTGIHTRHLGFAP